MAYWLMKSEPEVYSYDDLVAQGRDQWDGVKNAVALKHMRAMRPGDRFLFYHSGTQRAVVGVGQIVSEPYPDPALADPRYVVVDVAPEYRLSRPVTLAEIKGDPDLADWELVRLPRLSVMPVTERQWQRIHELARR
ncbi:MAG TPA: EVE domain-containing protein [Symbiobacteriaceae bacterium]